MTGFFKRWKRRKQDATANQKPVAEFRVTIYPDRINCNIDGDEKMIGGALVTLMLENQYSHQIVKNSVIAVERVHERNSAFLELMTFNQN